MTLYFQKYVYIHALSFFNLIDSPVLHVRSIMIFPSLVEENKPYCPT